MGYDVFEERGSKPSIVQSWPILASG